MTTVEVGREHDSLYVRLALSGSDTPPTASRYITNDEGTLLARSLADLLDGRFITHEQLSNLKDNVRADALADVRSAVIESVHDEDLDRDSANTLLERLGLDEVPNLWTVTASHPSYYPLFTVTVEAEDEDDAIEKVQERVNVTVSVNIDDLDGEFDWQDESETLAESFYDRLNFSAEQE